MFFQMLSNLFLFKIAWGFENMLFESEKTRESVEWWQSLGTVALPTLTPIASSETSQYYVI